MNHPFRQLMLQAAERSPTQGEMFDAIWEIVELELDAAAKCVRRLRAERDAARAQAASAERRNAAAERARQRDRWP